MGAVFGGGVGELHVLADVVAGDVDALVARGAGGGEVGAGGGEY